jgi:hypothetical protein
VVSAVIILIALLTPASALTQRTSSTAVLVGSNSVQSGRDNDAAGMAEAFQYTALASGHVTSMSLYIDSGSRAKSVSVGIYADSSGKPGALLTMGTIVHPVSSAWNTAGINAGVPSTAVQSGTKYWLALLGLGGQVNFRDLASRGGPNQNSAQSNLSSLPSTWSSGHKWANSPASLFASTATDQATPTPTATATLTSTPTPTPTATPTSTPTATPSSTATPSPTSSSGPVQANCFASPGKCGYPDPAAPYQNVGVPPGTQLTPVAQAKLPAGATWDATDNTLTISGNNVTVSGLKVVNDSVYHGEGSAVYIKGSDDILENTFVEASQPTNCTNCGATSGIQIDGLGAQLINDEVYSPPSPDGLQRAVYNLSGAPTQDSCQKNASGLYTTPTPVSCPTNAWGLYTTGADGGWYGGGDIENSFMLAQDKLPGDHVENIFDDGSVGGSLTVNHDTLFNLAVQTANVFPNGSSYTYTITETNNLLSGGGYSFYGNSATPGLKMTVTGNRFARCLTTPFHEISGDSGNWFCSGSGSSGSIGSDSHGLYPYAGSYDTNRSFDSSRTTWSGNYWDDNPAEPVGEE